ncbi:hypothetical protein VTK26DRAFT_591 [Humicola hyalothermophila]
MGFVTEREWKLTPVAGCVTVLQPRSLGMGIESGTLPRSLAAYKLTAHTWLPLISKPLAHSQCRTNSRSNSARPSLDNDQVILREMGRQTYSKQPLLERAWTTFRPRTFLERNPVAPRSCASARLPRTSRLSCRWEDGPTIDLGPRPVGRRGGDGVQAATYLSTKTPTTDRWRSTGHPCECPRTDWRTAAPRGRPSRSRARRSDHCACCWLGSREV